MGASQSSQPPSRQSSRHDKPHHATDNKAGHKQRAASVSTPMKQPTIPVVIDQPQSSTDAKVTEVQSVPLPAVAVPIPVRRKPASLPASGENSYIEDKRDPDLLQ